MRRGRAGSTPPHQDRRHGRPAPAASPRCSRELIEAGVDVFRLNFSHGTAADHAENVSRIREAAREGSAARSASSATCPGRSSGSATLEDDVAVLHSGSTVRAERPTADGPLGDAERLPVQWEGSPGRSRRGDPIFLADGRVRLRVVSVDGDEVTPRSRPAAPSAPTRG